MKRKYALAAALVVALVLPLFGCQKNAGEKLSEEEVQRQAYEYLVSRYSAEFTITNAKHEPDVVGPIPSFRSSFHWVLTVVSDRFPDDTFELRYGRFGKGNGKPVFADKNIRVKERRIVGKNRNVLKLTLEDEFWFCYPAVCFSHAEQMADLLDQQDKISIVYYPEINSYMGREEVQFVISNYC